MTILWNIQLKKRYQDELRSFELDIHLRSQAKRLVLFGPSGAGKTQILKMIAGLIRPDDGLVQLNGDTLLDTQLGINQAPQTRALAYVFQDYALFPHLTVRQNIAFSTNKFWFNKGRSYTTSNVDTWMDKLQLTALANHYPHQLSGGQSQRVALARALVSQPKGLLLDEPFAALDQHLRRALRGELRVLLEQLAIPMILISHDQEDVDLFGEEIVAIEEGKTS
jgi:molybdate transport system ATP-binding protein